MKQVVASIEDRSSVLKPLALSLALLAPLPATAEVYLLMAEEAGCMWCARWNRDVGPVYPKTAEGRAAPLVRYDIHGDTPDVDFARRVMFTPTFILVEDGQERGRIEGYPGEDFFWGLLGRMLEDAGLPLDPSG